MIITLLLSPKAFQEELFLVLFFSCFISAGESKVMTAVWQCTIETDVDKRTKSA